MSTPATHVIVHDESHASLQLVSREIANELNEARSALEAFAENPAERGALHRFAAHIHLARGALRLAEVYGGALLAEEMEQVARYVDTHSGAGQADADGLDALMRAMEQLPSYVDRVASGGRDVPLALLPLLNDLRAVRGGQVVHGAGRGGQGVAQQIKGRLDFVRERPAPRTSFEMRMHLRDPFRVQIAEQVQYLSIFLFRAEPVKPLVVARRRNAIELLQFACQQLRAFLQTAHCTFQIAVNCD